jgi:uncharacterized membrane protein
VLSFPGWFSITLFRNTLSTEYAFPLLATTLALEAVLLTSCVLIRQSLIDRTLERRDYLELPINLLAEREATRSLRILQRIAKKMDVDLLKTAGRMKLQARRRSMR